MKQEVISNSSRGGILIVDDSVADRAILRHLLYPYEKEFPIVGECSSIEDAENFLTHHQPDCCLLDYHLAGGRGIDLLKQIRASEEHAFLPTVLVTNHIEEDKLVEIIREGAHEYVKKQGMTHLSLYKAMETAKHRSALQQRLHELAHYDPLTGLLNRRIFIDRLSNAVENAKRQNEKCSLVFLDLDHFKQINDNLGHDAGDFLLKEVANRIKSACRASDSVARLGGDEFVVLLPNTDSTHGHFAALKLLAAISKTIRYGSQDLQISPSIGIAEFPTTAQTSHELLKQADDALYEAKRLGRAQYVKYTEKHKNDWMKREKLITALKHDIETGQLNLAFQPVFNLHSQHIRSIEALFRWPSAPYPTSKSEIFNLAGQLKLQLPLQEWIFEKALECYTRWYSTSTMKILLTLNIPSELLQLENFHVFIDSIIRRHGISPDLIELDFAEIKNLKSVKSQLIQLANMGFNIAIDDFGTEAYALTFLSQLPISTVKFDYQNINRMTPNAVSCVQGMNQMVHSLGYESILKGIENGDTLHLSLDASTDGVQGNYLSEPLWPTQYEPQKQLICKALLEIS